MKNKKVLYSGRDASGKDVNGFVEADSLDKARRILDAKGVSEIVLHDDMIYLGDRPDLEGLSSKELARTAKFELRMRKQPSTASFLQQVILNNKVMIGIGALIVVAGVWQQRWMMVAVGLLLMFLMPIIALVNYQSVVRYNRFLACIAIGQWTEALEIAEQLREMGNQPELQFDIAIREASILAAQGNVTDALAAIEPWKAHYDDSSPGLVESRLSGIYHAAGHYDQYLETQRKAYRLSTGSPMITIDAALAEARMGDIERAKDLLEELVSTEALSPLAPPFIDWMRGAIAYRQGELSNAVGSLGNAVSTLLDYQKNPVSWVSLAMCSASYALALHDCGEVEKAQAIVDHVSDILSVHGEPALLTELTRVGLISPAPSRLASA